MSQILFLKSTTESASVNAGSLSHMKYDSAGVIVLLFSISIAGKAGTIEIKLNTETKKEQQALIDLTNLLKSKSIVVFSNIATDSSERLYNNKAVTRPASMPSKSITSIESITYIEDPVTAQVGPAGQDAQTDEVLLDVRADETISKGDPLYITGYNSGQNRITVAKADASDSAKMPSIGLASADYSQNDNGTVVTIGSLVDIDTSAFSVGATVYVASGGGLTTTKPTGTNLIQNVGEVGRSNSNNGEIVVMAIGRSNDVPNLPAGKFFIGSSTNTTTSAYTLPTSDGTANQVLTTDGAGSVSFASFSASDVVNDLSPQLGGSLDVQSFNLFTSTTNGDIQFTPSGTGSINLDGSVQFRRFSSAPTAFEGGMYADDQDNLYFGVS